MYTSGTTGDPKGVLISNKSIITIVSAVDEFLINSGEEVCLQNLLQSSVSQCTVSSFYKIVFCSNSFARTMFTFLTFHLLIFLTG